MSDSYRNLMDCIRKRASFMCKNFRIAQVK